MILDGLFELLTKLFKFFKRNNAQPSSTSNDVDQPTQAGRPTKEEASARKEPWVDIIKVHIDQDNPRNAFFEFDWNEYFVLWLKEQGFQGNTEEEVVDHWFMTLVHELSEDEQANIDRRTGGYIDIRKLLNGRSEAS